MASLSARKTSSQSTQKSFRSIDKAMKEICLFVSVVLVFGISSGLAQQETNSPKKRPHKKPPVVKLEGGVEITSVKDAQDMTLPHEQFPAIHFVRSNEFFKKFSDRKSTPSGLYLLDTELIPKQLPVILAKNGVDFGPDGSLINQKGKRMVMLLGYKLVAIRKKQGSLLDRFAPTTAFAARPFPLEWVSAWYSFADDEGFCRSLTSTASADAWGPMIIPWWGVRVHTNIEQIEVYEQAADVQDDKICTDCAWQSAQAYKDFGCWWPAHDDGQWGWADLKDGSFNWAPSW